MSSLISFGIKRVVANKSLFVRQLSMKSTNLWKTDSQKLFSAFNERKTNVLIGQPLQSLIYPMTWRLSSNAALDQSGHKTQLKTGHNHSKLWSFERYLSIGLLAVIPTSFVLDTPVMDYLLALSLVTHIHWGVEAIVVDYIRPSVFGKVIPKLSLVYLYVLSVLALSGLFYFNYTDVGLTKAMRMISKI